MDCLWRNLEGTWPDLRMSEEFEEPKITPMFSAQVYTAGAQVCKGEKGGDASDLGMMSLWCRGQSMGTDTLE